MALYAQSNRDIVPACYSNQCPIEEIATDEEATEFVEKFQIAKTLTRATDWPAAQETLINELGLKDDPEFWLKLECLDREWLEMFRQQNNKGKK